MNQRCLDSAVFAICISLLAIVSTGSCGRSTIDPGQTAVPVESKTSTEGQADSASIGVDRQALDEAVIEAALRDLITADDDDSEMLRREQGKGEVMFSGECRDRAGLIEDVFRYAESEKWHSMDSADHRAAQEAAAMVIERVEGKQCFTPFRPRDARISLWEDDPASTQPTDLWSPRSLRPVRAAPPGYGDQNRLAVVVFSFPWSMHSGNAVYVLRFDGEAWHVISRHYLYYA